jgi:membrane fusion protein (multidrug efflux system)
MIKRIMNLTGNPVLRSNMSSHPCKPRLLLLFGLAWLTGWAPAADRPPPSVIVSEVRLKQFSDPLEALGTLTANESVELTATVSETISAIHFDDGERVERGQVLVEMTSREEHAQLEEARATVDEAQRQYQRIVSLEAQGTAAKSLLDERKREWETARARLAAIESRLADRLIKAPFSGVLGLRELSVGALVQPGELIITLDDDSVMKLEFQIPGSYLEAVQPGLEIAATARAFPGRSFAGNVKSISSRIDPVTRSIRVRAILPNPERLLKPGLLMQVVLLNNPRETLVIPEQALTPLDKRQFVYTVEVDPEHGHKAMKREIHIGTRRPGEVEVLEGLQAGDLVISQGILNVRPGQPVTISTVDDGSRPLAEILRSLPGGSKAE